MQSSVEKDYSSRACIPSLTGKVHKIIISTVSSISICGRHGVLVVSTLDSGASSRSGFEPCHRGHCVVFLGKTLYSHSASLHSGV